MNVLDIEGGVRTDIGTLLGMVQGKTFQVLVVENDDLTKYTTAILIEGVDGYLLVGEVFDHPKDAYKQTREVVNQLADLTKHRVAR